MLNIGEISKPSVSESPVRPRRASSDGELVTQTDPVESSAQVKTPFQQKKHQQSKHKASKPETKNQKQSSAKTSQQIDECIYDQQGHQQHHGQLDVNA